MGDVYLSVANNKISNKHNGLQWFPYLKQNIRFNNTLFHMFSFFWGLTISGLLILSKGHRGFKITNKKQTLHKTLVPFTKTSPKTPNDKTNKNLLAAKNRVFQLRLRSKQGGHCEPHWFANAWVCPMRYRWHPPRWQPEEKPKRKEKGKEL